MTVWTAPGTLHTGTFNLTRGTADWYIRPDLAPSNEVVVDNLDPVSRTDQSYRDGWHDGAAAVRATEARSATAQTLRDYHQGYLAGLNDAATPVEGRVSVESSARHDTKELGLENSLPQTSLRNKPDVIEVASLRYFTEDGVRYWTLHTELERLDRHQLVALAEMVRAEQAKRR